MFWLMISLLVVKSQKLVQHLCFCWFNRHRLVVFLQSTQPLVISPSDGSDGQ
jgi:hypothetical protein